MNPARLAIIGALGAMIGSVSGGAHLMGVALSMALGAAMMLYVRRRPLTTSEASWLILIPFLIVALVKIASEWLDPE